MLIPDRGVNQMLKINRFHICFVSILILISFSTSAYARESLTITREDKKSVPIIVYSPANTCRGIVIISHGAGASEMV